MKNLLIVLSCIGFFVNVNSQIINAEYFIDAVDPGVGNANALTVTSGNTINENFTIPITGLSNGIHVLHIRAKGTNNVWSLYKRAYFYVQPSIASTTPKNIVAAEYFIDAEQVGGIGSQSTLTVATQGLTVNELFAIPTAGLTDGIHVLHIRVKDAGNVWSLYKRAYFYVQPSIASTTPKNIVAAEYFIDTEQVGGVGSQSTLTVATQGLTVNELFAIPTTGLANGTHILHIRVKDAGNVWSLYKRAYFYVNTPNLVASTPIVAAEYFFGTAVGDDPGVGNATALTITQGLTVNETVTIPIPNSMVNGDYYVHIRVKDQSGVWALYKRAIFTIDNVLSVEELDSSIFKIYPNPSKDAIYIDFQEVGEYSLSIFDITGKELHQQIKLEQQNKVDLSKYATGIYYLKIKEIATNKIQNIKIIKE